MALLSQQLQSFLLTQSNSAISSPTITSRSLLGVRTRTRSCSAIAIDSQSSSLTGIRWGSTSLQGPREEMEDDVVLRSDGLDGFSFAAVFDRHVRFKSWFKGRIGIGWKTVIKTGMILIKRLVLIQILIFFIKLGSRLLLFLEVMFMLVYIALPVFVKRFESHCIGMSSTQSERCMFCFSFHNTTLFLFLSLCRFLHSN